MTEQQYFGAALKLKQIGDTSTDAGAGIAIISGAFMTVRTIEIQVV